MAKAGGALYVILRIQKCHFPYFIWSVQSEICSIQLKQSVVLGSNVQLRGELHLNLYKTK